jgi:HEAT repeat protein
LRNLRQQLFGLLGSKELPSARTYPKLPVIADNRLRRIEMDFLSKLFGKKRPDRSHVAPELSDPPNIEKLIADRDVTGLVSVLRTGNLQVTTHRDFEDFEYTKTKDENRVRRIEAAEALGVIGDPRAVKPLIEEFRLSSQTDDQYFLDALGQALAKFGTPAVQPLISLLQDERVNGHNKVRGSNGRGLVAQILGQSGDARAVKPLIALLLNKGGWPYWWNDVIDALVKIGDARAIEPLGVFMQNYTQNYPFDNMERYVKAQWALEKLQNKSR